MYFILNFIILKDLIFVRLKNLLDFVRLKQIYLHPVIIKSCYAPRRISVAHDEKIFKIETL